MLLNWNDSRCILCLTHATLTVEHVIPQSLGGILRIPFLCKSCNDQLGYQVEALAKKDPTIKLAVEQVRPVLPDDVVKKLVEGQDYFAESAGGTVRGCMKDDIFRVKGAKRPDGSIILPTNSGWDLIEKYLTKSGVSKQMILEKLLEFDSVPDDSRIQIDQGLSAVKWSIGDVYPTLDGEPLADSLILKIAYEFLACILWKGIYNETPTLAEVRDTLRHGKSLGPMVRLESLRADKHDSFHGIAFQGNSPHAVILVRLFGWLTYRVHFNQIVVNAPRIIYTHRLDRGEDSWHISPASMPLL